jgi:hypothetical protein
MLPTSDLCHKHSGRGFRGSVPRHGSCQSWAEPFSEVFVRYLVRMSPRVLAVWLDGFEMGLADSWGLPHLAALTRRAAVATLDNGTAHLTGLSAEHLSTGHDPVAAGRASAVHFDPVTYRCVQQGAQHPPVIGGIPTTVFDIGYFDLERTGPEVHGLTDWGAHDPGGPPAARPTSLHEEIESRFGAYPARQWLYATPWASPAQCAQMGLNLTAAVETRSRIATWLLAERCADWKLALIGISEAHSASEGLYHGVSADHPLAQQPSARNAAVAIRSVYRAIDQMVDDLVKAFPDAIIVVFSMHGMGQNHSDVPSMALLGELVARWAGLSTPPAAFPVDRHLVPQMNPNASWSTTVLAALQPDEPARRGARVKTRIAALARLIATRLPASIRQPLEWARCRITTSATGHDPSGLTWMPLVRHQPHWPAMKAFAVPSFYDGRIRVNLRGREASGIVGPDRYIAILDELETVLRTCREPRSGANAVSAVHRRGGDPFHLDPTDADLVVDWAPGVLGLEHPSLGTIGPLPPRRTGGHSNPIGRCLVTGPGVVPADLGTHSSFDVLPTLLHLAGVEPAWTVSGTPLPVPTAVPTR